MSYRKHREFITHGIEEIPIWRYMDFWKFLDLIKSQELYFSSPFNFGDKNEGKIPDKIFDMMCNDPKLGLEGATRYKNGLPIFAKKIYISSWVSKESESFAHWKMYSKDKIGIAIKTSLSGLKKSFEVSEDHIYIGKVNYLNPHKLKYRLGNYFYSFLQKNNYYDFESEVRCILKKSGREKIGLPGVRIPINLKNLIDEVVISQKGESVGQKSLINRIVSERNLDLNISVSGIQDDWI